MIGPKFSEDFLGILQKLLSNFQDEKDLYKPENKHKYYKETVEHAEEMGWHVYGNKPERLLNRARPREDPAITAYRLSSYEPITESKCKKALSMVHKIFDPNLSSITFKDGQNQELLKKYTTEDYPVFNSVISYVANFVLKKMIADPNGILLVEPADFAIKGFESVTPVVRSYASKDIWLINLDYALLFDEYEETDKTKEWEFTYVDKIGIYKLTAVMLKSGNGTAEINVTVDEGYELNAGKMPLWYLSGEYSECDEGLYESFFQPAVPFWNEAINDHSDVTGGYRMHMWPQKWEIADECEYVEITEGGRFACQGGYIHNPSSERGKYSCPSCGGAGYKSAKSPYETIQVNRDRFGDEGKAGGQIPVGYVTVPTDALKMLEDKAEANLLKGLDALNMNLEIGANQSGKAKEMDRSELNDFLQRISDTCFDKHLTNIYHFFTLFMFNVSAKDQVNDIEPQIAKPNQFDVYSSTELAEQFSEAKKAKLNPSYLTTKQAEIQNKEFQTRPDLLAKLNLELRLDPLSEVNSDEVALKLNTGTITKESAIIHDNIGPFIIRAMEDDKTFKDKKYSEQIAVLDKYAKEIIKQTQISIDTAALELQNQQPGNTTTAFAREPVLKK